MAQYAPRWADTAPGAMPQNMISKSCLRTSGKTGTSAESLLNPAIYSLGRVTGIGVKADFRTRRMRMDGVDYSLE